MNSMRSRPPSPYAVFPNGFSPPASRPSIRISSLPASPWITLPAFGVPRSTPAWPRATLSPIVSSPPPPRMASAPPPPSKMSLPRRPSSASASVDGKLPAGTVPTPPLISPGVMVSAALVPLYVPMSTLHPNMLRLQDRAHRAPFPATNISKAEVPPLWAPLTLAALVLQDLPVHSIICTWRTPVNGCPLTAALFAPVLPLSVFRLQRPCAPGVKARAAPASGPRPRSDRRD